MALLDDLVHDAYVYNFGMVLLQVIGLFGTLALAVRWLRNTSIQSGIALGMALWLGATMPVAAADRFLSAIDDLPLPPLPEPELDGDGGDGATEAEPAAVGATGEDDSSS